MCGIIGFYSPKKTISLSSSVLAKMTKTLQHRGPDDAGIWSNESEGVGIGHRRLSIIDVSSAGQQPMSSASDRYRIVFNGEIYNFRTLRSQLIKLGYSFIGHSDTEVILAAFEEWGIERSVKQFNGMFAIAVWDAKLRQISLVRDRLGIKPLYYYLGKSSIIFGSELSPLIVSGEVDKAISPKALTAYLRYGYVVGEQSMLLNVFRLKPGHILTFKIDGSTSQKTYWDPKETITMALSTPFQGSLDEAVLSLHDILADSVNLRMISDVPLGAFLSGGIDSSLIVAIMQELSNKPIKTFTIGFNEKMFNEAQYAKKVASHLKTDHTELYVSARDAMDVVPQIAQIYDEPFADVSQIPSYLVSKLAKNSVTVALSGDGGDELFGGYSRYQFIHRYWRLQQYCPKILRALLSCSMRSIKKEHWDSLFKFVSHLCPKMQSPSLPGLKIYKLASLLNANNLLEGYQRILSKEIRTDLILNSEYCASTPLFLDEINQQDVVNQMYWDAKLYLVDDVLTKMDRATMSVGIESRVPFLDHRLFEFSWQLSLDMKIRAGSGKRILRALLSKYLPESMIERQKMGFSVPIGEWLKGPLRDFAENYLSVSSLNQSEIFNAKQVNHFWRQHLSNKSSYSHSLWSIIVFQMWFEKLTHGI